MARTVNEKQDFQFWDDNEEEDEKFMLALIDASFTDWNSPEDEEVFAYLQ